MLLSLLARDHELCDRGDGGHLSERLIERGLEQDERDLAVLQSVFQESIRMSIHFLFFVKDAK